MERLLTFQQQVGAISKDSTNPFFSSKYFDINGLLEAIKPVLNELGLIITQPLTNIDGKPAIETMIVGADGKVLIKSTIPLPELADPQKMGSAITYYRRYSLQSMLALQAEDDDGNHASQPTQTQSIKPVAPATSVPPAKPWKKWENDTPVKTEGATCSDCGGKMVKNPKTGKVFCENKCWLPENNHLRNKKEELPTINQDDDIPLPEEIPF